MMLIRLGLGTMRRGRRWDTTGAPVLTTMVLTTLFSSEEEEGSGAWEEGEEGVEEGAEDSEAPLHSYPIRCSFSFTKVRSPSPVGRHVCLCLVHF